MKFVIAAALRRAWKNLFFVVACLLLAAIMFASAVADDGWWRALDFGLGACWTYMAFTFVRTPKERRRR